MSTPPAEEVAEPPPPPPPPPPTLDGESRRRRRRTTFTLLQRNYLETCFRQNPYPNTDQRRIIAEALHVQESSVMWWFGHRRAKEMHQPRRVDDAAALYADLDMEEISSPGHPPADGSSDDAEAPPKLHKHEGSVDGAPWSAAGAALATRGPGPDGAADPPVPLTALDAPAVPFRIYLELPEFPVPSPHCRPASVLYPRARRFGQAPKPASASPPRPLPTPPAAAFVPPSLPLPPMPVFASATPQPYRQRQRYLHTQPALQGSVPSTSFGPASGLTPALPLMMPMYWNTPVPTYLGLPADSAYAPLPPVSSLMAPLPSPPAPQPARPSALEFANLAAATLARLGPERPALFSPPSMSSPALAPAPPPPPPPPPPSLVSLAPTSLPETQPLGIAEGVTATETI